VLTHGNVTWNAVNVLVDHDLIAGERAPVSAPLFHTAGLNMLTLPVLLKGSTCVLVESSADPSRRVWSGERSTAPTGVGQDRSLWRVSLIDTSFT
jgi:fatty-acyl-CoA synthase